MTIRNKLWSIFLLTLVVMGILTAVFLTEQRYVLMQDRKNQTRQLVETALGVLDYYQGLQSRGLLSEEQAKASSIAQLKTLRYDGKNYFWINDMQPRMVMHPFKPELDGKDISDFQDPNGIRLFVEGVKAVRQQGAGFVDYRWPKPGSKDPVPKISYVKGFLPWGWVVGSGIYVDDVDAIFREQLLVYGALVLLIAAIAGGFQLVTIGEITGRLKNLTSTVAYIGQHRDLTVRVDAQGADEISQIGQGFNTMLENLHQSFRQIASSAEELSGAAEVLAKSTHHILDSSNKQNDAAASMAAAVEQVTVSVNTISGNADAAQSLARLSGGLAEEGGSVIRHVVAEIREIADVVVETSTTVEGLRQASDQISSVVSVIKEVADQTNLLALNAAIEAARAGEYGRGFAVVADEVRKLAEHTSHSTQEIARMIHTIQGGAFQSVSRMQEAVDRVGQGVSLANRAGASIDEINDSSQKVASSVSDISSALREQSAASNDIARNVERIAQMTETNRLAVVDVAATATQLEKLAKSLNLMASKFKMEDRNRPGTT